MEEKEKETREGTANEGVSRGRFLKTVLAGLGVVGLTFMDNKAALAQTSCCTCVNVKDYGATGNGTTDDTTAIQNAINAATGGRTVYFPNGTYKISGTLSVTIPGVTLQGESRSGALIKRTNNNGGISVQSADVTIMNLGTVGGNTGITGGPEVEFTSGGVRGFVKECDLYNNGNGQCIAVIASDCKIVNNNLFGSGSSAIGNIGLWADPSGGVIDLVIKGNTFKNHGVSALFVSGRGVIISNNYLINNHMQTYPSGGGQIDITQESLTDDQVGFVVADNTIVDAGGSETIGIECHTSNAVITGNYIDRQGSNGIVVQRANSKNVVIVGNIVKNGQREGILVNNSITDFEINGNTVVNNARYGIYVLGPSNNNFIIQSNIIRNNASANIRDDSTGTNKIVRDNISI